MKTAEIIKPRGTINVPGTLVKYFMNDGKQYVHTDNGIFWMNYIPSEVLHTDINEMDLMPRTYHVLNQRGFKTAGDLLPLTQGDLLKYRNFGKRCLMDLEEALDKLGLTLNK